MIVTLRTERIRTPAFAGAGHETVYVFVRRAPVRLDYGMNGRFPGRCVKHNRSPDRNRDAAPGLQGRRVGRTGRGYGCPGAASGLHVIARGTFPP